MGKGKPDSFAYNEHTGGPVRPQHVKHQAAELLPEDIVNGVNEPAFVPSRRSVKRSVKSHIHSEKGASQSTAPEASTPHSREHPAQESDPSSRLVGNNSATNDIPNLVARPPQEKERRRLSGDELDEDICLDDQPKEKPVRCLEVEERSENLEEKRLTETAVKNNSQETGKTNRQHHTVEGNELPETQAQKRKANSCAAPIKTCPSQRNGKPKSSKRPRVTFAGIGSAPKTPKQRQLTDQTKSFVSPSLLARLARPTPTLLLSCSARDNADGHEQAIVDDLQYILDSANANKWSPSSRASLMSLVNILTQPKKRQVMKEHKLVKPTFNSVWMILVKFASIPEAYRTAWFVVALLTADSTFHEFLDSSEIMASEDRKGYVEHAEKPHDKAMLKAVKDKAELNDFVEILQSSRAMHTQLFRLHTILLLVASNRNSRAVLDENQDAVLRFISSLRSSMETLGTGSKSKSLLLKVRKLLGVLEYAATTPTSRNLVHPLVTPMLSVLGCPQILQRDGANETGESAANNNVKWPDNEPSVIGGCLRILINVSHSKVALSAFVRHKGVRGLLGFLYRSMEDWDASKAEATDHFDNRVLSIALLARVIEQSQLIALEFLDAKVETVTALEFVINLLGSQSTLSEGKEEGKVAEAEDSGSNDSRLATARTERGVTVGYLALLIGAVWQQAASAREAIRACLPESSGPESIAEVLDEFLQFQKDAGCVNDGVEERYRQIIESLANET